MGYTPENNPYIPGDPYSYDLAWMVQEVKKAQAIVPPAEAARDIAIEKADIATEKADVASAEADQSEAWAVGRKNNIPVSADEPQYENHSKYWADQSFESATNAQISEENAAASELAAKNYADNIADPVSGIVTSWLTDHISNPSNPPLDTSLSVGSAAADSAAVGEALMNKLTIGGSADYTLWSQIAIFSDSGLPPTRRWFINKIFRIGTYIDTIDFDFSNSFFPLFKSIKLFINFLATLLTSFLSSFDNLVYDFTNGFKCLGIAKTSFWKSSVFKESNESNKIFVYFSRSSSVKESIQLLITFSTYRPDNDLFLM